MDTTSSRMIRLFRKLFRIILDRRGVWFIYAGVQNPQTEQKRGICGICPAGCEVIIELKHGRIERVQADEQAPDGMICKIGQHSSEIVYSPDRIQTPLLRKGEKGNFHFEPITWDRAYDIIVKKLNHLKNEYGAESTAVYTGRGSFDLAACDVFQPAEVAVSSASSVLFPFGSPNTLGAGAFCYVSFAMIAPHTTMGRLYINMAPDIENADLILVWGTNPLTDTPPKKAKLIKVAHARGAKVIVIDPRKTGLAELPGAEWIPVRPGTDGALALGLLRELIYTNRYDRQFVKDWTIGFEELREYVQPFTPEKVEELTGVPTNMLLRLADRIDAAKAVSPVMYTGLEYTNSGTQNIRATFILWGITGNLDIPGGLRFTETEANFKVNRSGLLPNPAMGKALGRKEHPLYTSYREESHAVALPESVLNGNPYKIRGLIIQGASLITSWPRPEIWRKTLKKLDFLVCIDRVLTADAAYADIVLPASTQYEIDSYMVYGNRFRLRRKVIEPVGESRSDFFIMAELANRLGYGHLFPQTYEELLDYILKGTGFSREQVLESEGEVSLPPAKPEFKKWETGKLRTDGKPGFETPSGKLEITSSILERAGYDALPVYTPPSESASENPELAKKYPLVFNSGARLETVFRSQHLGIPGLIRNNPDPAVTLHAHDAKVRGIRTGDTVRIETARGSVRMKAIVTSKIMRGSIEANMGGGGPLGPESWKNCNINELTDLKNLDPISGFPVYKALLCEVSKLEDDRNISSD